MYTYEYPRPALTADIALFNLDETEILLIRRGNEPYKNCWALPGGFFDMNDRDIEHTAARELEEETGLSNIELIQRLVASRDGRDPRGRTVSIVFSGHVDTSIVCPKGGDDAAEARWFPVKNPPQLAFDHDEILEKLTKRCK